MRFALMIEAQQGLSYKDQLSIARRAEAGGFETLFRSDHYASFPGADDQPTTDAWAILAGLARETSKIGLGTLVSPVTFRHPGNFVKLVTTVDQMSGGRLEVGVGAGWNEADHDPLGLPFPSIEERANLMEDQLALLHGLWEEAPGWTFDGHQVRVRGGALVPGPFQRAGRPIGRNGRTRPRIITGSEGSPRGFRLAVRYSDEFNLSSATPDIAREKQVQIDAACAAAARDPRSLTRSAMVGVLIGATDADVERRAADLLVTVGGSGDARAYLDQRRSRWIIGTPDEARAMVRRYAEAGIERIMLQDMLPRDGDMIDLMAKELVGKV
jgi:alkanesulfonate monooxygenase SsuD/methylene tetrahydromethanopterin reductase-like flavin-dependent oxidoreductase (luciferase family)